MTRNQLELLLRLTTAVKHLIMAVNMPTVIEEEMLARIDEKEQEVRHDAGLSTHVDEGKHGQTTQADGGAGPGDTATT